MSYAVLYMFQSVSLRKNEFDHGFRIDHVNTMYRNGNLRIPSENDEKMYISVRDVSV